MDLLAEPAGRDQRHPLHVLGEEVGELHRDPAAERVAHDGAALEAEHRQQVADPGGVGAQRVVAPGLGRAAVADHVGGDHRVALGELRHHLAPGIRGRCDPVQQHQQRPLAGGLEADRMAVQGDLLVGPERLAGGAPARGLLKRCRLLHRLVSFRSRVLLDVDAETALRLVVDDLAGLGSHEFRAMLVGCGRARRAARLEAGAISLPRPRPGRAARMRPAPPRC